MLGPGVLRLESLRNTRADNRKYGSLDVIRQIGGSLAWRGGTSDLPTPRHDCDNSAMTWTVDGSIPPGILLFNPDVNFVN